MPTFSLVGLLVWRVLQDGHLCFVYIDDDDDYLSSKWYSWPVSCFDVFPEFDDGFRLVVLFLLAFLSTFVDVEIGAVHLFCTNSPFA